MSGKRFTSRHLSYRAFDITVNMLNPVIQVFALPDGDIFFLRVGGTEHCQSSGTGATFNERHHFGFSVLADDLA